MNLNNLSSLATTNSALADSAGKNSKLHNAAEQFESLVIGEMLRAQRESGSGGWMGSDDGDDSASDSAMDIAESQFANSLSAAGGLGLARMIEKTMSHQADNANVRAGAALSPPSS